MFRPKNPFPHTNVPRTIRFTQEIFDKLLQVSGKTGLSFNSLVLQCCEYALQNLETASTRESV